jgi:TPR repeat protein
VEKDFEKAKTYLRRAAELGIAEYQESLARLILYQKDPPDDEEREEAMRWYKTAADGGLSSAQIGYGYALMYPRTGGKREAAKAVEVLKLAAANGRKDANRWLGDIYFDKQFSGNNTATAIQYYRTGAEQDDASCQASLGAAYFDGRGVEPNLERAVEWLLKAAEQKNTTAYYHLGRVYSGQETKKVPPGFRPDFEKAIDWFQKAAADGHVNSGYLHGKIIDEGLIPWKEKSEAIPIFEAAAKAGHHWARDRILDFKAEQAAGRKNEDELLEDLALQGGTVAFMRLADRYRGREAARIDPPQLFRYEAGGEMHGGSGISSVLAHLKGSFPMTRPPKLQVVQADYQAIQTALRQNDAAYFRQLAQRYVDGTVKNPTEACIWLGVAASYGHATAGQEAAKLEASLGEKQRARIQEWVRLLLMYQGQGFNR